MKNLKRFAKDTFTGIDGESIDIGRVLWAAGAVVFFVLSIFAVMIKGQVFDAMAYGTAFGAILAGGGAALGFKAKTEPQEAVVETKEEK